MFLPQLRLLGLLASALTFMAWHIGAGWLAGHSRPRARALLARWCRHAWGWLGLSVKVDGPLAQGPCVYVANHRSYLDILVLAGVLDATFLSRDDISRWAIVGRAARDTGVVFVDRSDPKARALAARALERRLGVDSLIVFPEGTTTGERLPGHFEGGLFRMLHRSGAPVVPVTLRYSRAGAYWLDASGVREHLVSNVFEGRRLRVEVSVGEALRPAPQAC